MRSPTKGARARNGFGTPLGHPRRQGSSESQSSNKLSLESSHKSKIAPTSPDFAVMKTPATARRSLWGSDRTQVIPFVSSLFVAFASQCVPAAGGGEVFAFFCLAGAFQVFVPEVDRDVVRACRPSHDDAPAAATQIRKREHTREHAHALAIRPMLAAGINRPSEWFPVIALVASDEARRPSVKCAMRFTQGHRGRLRLRWRGGGESRHRENGECGSLCFQGLPRRSFHLPMSAMVLRDRALISVWASSQSIAQSSTRRSSRTTYTFFSVVERRWSA